MRVEVVKDFLWAGEDGNSVRTVPAGRVCEGREAQAALAMGCGRDLDADGKALEGAPMTQAAARAPRNKGR